MPESKLPPPETPTDWALLQNLLSAAERLPHPHLAVGDLGPDMQVWLGEQICRALRHRSDCGLDVPDDVIYLMVINSMGIDCPHSRAWRYWWYPKGTYECEICGAWFAPAGSPAGKEG